MPVKVVCLKHVCQAAPCMGSLFMLQACPFPLVATRSGTTCGSVDGGTVCYSLPGRGTLVVLPHVEPPWRPANDGVAVVRPHGAAEQAHSFGMRERDSAARQRA